MELSYEQIEELEGIELISDKKNYLQNIGLYSWLKNPKSYFEWCTGTGKTRMLCKIIKAVSQNFPNTITHIVVPNKPLVDEFKKNMKELDYDFKNVEIIVVNTYSKKLYVCDLLILDELHLMANEESKYFSKIISRGGYKNFAGASASLESSHVSYLKRYGITCCSKFTLEDSQRVGLSPKYSIFNIPVQLSEVEKLEYIKQDKIYQDQVRYFSSFDPINPFSVMTTILKGGKIGDEMAKKVSDHKKSLGLITEVGHVYRRSLDWRLSMTKRRDILNKALYLDRMAVKILQRIDRRVMIFCESIESCDYIESITPNSVSYHSKIPAKERNKNLKQFIEKKTKFLLSCKSLQAGIDDPDLNIVLRHSYNSKKRSSIQTLGRTMRITEENRNKKTVYFINLFVDDFIYGGEQYLSQQKKWLRSSLSGDPNVEWISFDELDFNRINNND